MQPPAQGPARALGLVAIAWIVIYWWWRPGGSTAILVAPINLPPAEVMVAPPIKPSGGPQRDEPKAEATVRASQPEADDADASSLQAEPLVDVRPVESALPDEPSLYVVVAGDTLSAIAMREYGSIRFAERIFDANRDQLGSMDDLQIGMELRLPEQR